MGQFGNQPDFITHDIKSILPSNDINSDKFLDGSVIYVGTSAVGGKLNVIPVGAVGPSVISGFSSLGYPGSNGTGYAPAAAVATTTSGSGTGLTVDITRTSVATGSIDYTNGLTLNTGAAQGYLNGDLVTITGGDTNAIFRIVASAGLPTAAQAVSFINLPQGEWFPVVVDYVLATDTTVSDLRAGK
jgi:hypothetical protein